ncbi:MAG: ComEC family competence protein, partial [Paramuribaculum sp.]|nr:ComEC family competence protein [Paramuribaculum sp.]
MTIAVVMIFINRYAAILILTFLTGMTDAYLSVPNGPNQALSNRELVIEGNITEVKTNETTLRLTLEVDHAGPDTISMVRIKPHSVSLVSNNPEFEAEIGQKLKLKTKLTPLTAIRDLPDEIDFADFAARKQIYLGAFFTRKQIIAIQPPGHLRALLNSSSEQLTRCISESALSPFAKEFMISALAGDTSDLSDTSRKLFTNAGISHVLAISGLHVGIIAFVISILLWPLYIMGFGRVRNIATIAVVWTYAFIIGFPASVARAALMATIYLAGRLMQRRSSPLNSLAFAALCILLFSPEAILQPGFQLSFAAVFAIIVLAGRMNPVSPRKRIAYNIASYVCVTLSAVIGTGLLTVFYFHSFPVYFLLGNILSALLLPFVIGGGIAMIIFNFTGLDSTLLCQVLNLLCEAIKSTCEFITALPGSSIDGIYLQKWIIIPAAASFIAIKLALDSKERKSICLTSVATVILMISCCFIASDCLTPEPRIYVARNKHHTDIIFPSNTELKIVTTAPNEPLNVTSRAEFRYRDYMQKRNIPSINVDT